MKTNLFVKSGKDKQSDAIIYLQLRHGAERTVFSTKIKVPAVSWDSNKQQIKPSYSRAFDLNKDLQKKTADCTNVIHEMRTSPDFGKAKILIADLLGKEPEEIKAMGTFFQVYDSFIKDYKLTKAKATRKSHENTKTILKAFKPHLDFNAITPAFFNAFANHLLYIKTDDKVMQTNNTANKHLANLRTFVNWAGKKDIKTVTLPKGVVKENVKKNDVEVIHLTEEELLHLYNLPLTNGKDRVRDLFCLGCWTGLRHSDILLVGKSNIRNNRIYLTMKKTGGQIVVPLNKYSKAIFEKYDYELPRISNQKCNDALKEICKIAEFDSLEKEVRFRGTTRIDVDAPKYELISFHDSRATFIILLLIKGIGQRVIMQMTGHKDYRSFEKYVKITESVTDDAMQLAWG